MEGRCSIRLKKHAFRLLDRLQLRVRSEAQPLAERFGDDNPPRFIDPDLHTISDTMCHLDMANFREADLAMAGEAFRRGSGGKGALSKLL
jgi:hypothetical protein